MEHRWVTAAKALLCNMAVDEAVFPDVLIGYAYLASNCEAGLGNTSIVYP